MTALSINSYQLALGVDWQLCDDRRMVRDRTLAAGSRVCQLADTPEGILLGVYTGERSARYAAAAVIGPLVTDAIIFQPLRDGSVWLCGIKDGYPLPGTDCCLPGDSALVQFQTLQAWLPQTRVIGQHPDAALGLEELLAHAERQQFRLARLTAPGNRLRLFYFLGAILTSVLFVIWAFWPDTASPDLAPFQLSASGTDLVIPVAEIPDTNGRSIQQRAEALRADWLTRPDAMVLATRWFDVLKELPVSAGGFQPRLITCSANDCLVRWRGVGPAHELRPAQIPGDGLQMFITSGLSEAETRIYLQDIPQRQLHPLDRTVVDERTRHLGQALQRRGMRADLMPLSGTQVANHSASNQAPVPLGAEGRVRITTGNLALAYQAVGLLSDYPVALDRGTFTLTNGALTLQWEGSYVAQP